MDTAWAEWFYDFVTNFYLIREKQITVEKRMNMDRMKRGKDSEDGRKNSWLKLLFDVLLQMKEIIQCYAALQIWLFTCKLLLITYIRICTIWNSDKCNQY